MPFIPDDFLFGSKGKTKQLSLQTKEQDELLKLIKESLTSGEGPLKDLFGDFDIGAFEEGVSKPALKQFQEQILPGILEKFAGQGLGSANVNAATKAGSDLQSKLAQLMYEARNQQKQNKLSGINTALGTKAVENIYQPGTEGAVQGFIKGVGHGVGTAGGAAIAG
jgi:hypothetical protein